ncbi:tRNA-splicing endonuclease subunit Sen34 isoform X2 [Lagopus leucura]|nr:tRNA-splicing endonuclease subunit Sen34 isoform X2 [Lagopus leucura]
MWGALVGAPSRRGGGRRLPLQLLPEEGRLLEEIGAARLEPEPETRRPEVGGKRPISCGLEVGVEGPDVGIKRSRLCGAAAGAEGVETDGREAGDERPEVDSEGQEVRSEGLEVEKPEVECKGPETERWEVETDWPEVDAVGPEVKADEPEAEAHRERRFRVYRDLWGRGLHLTAGGKFGGDFLVYPGPPPLFHAAAVALCPRSSAPLPLGALLSAARLGTAARKSLLLCAAPPGGACEYSALRWRRDMA